MNTSSFGRFARLGALASLALWARFSVATSVIPISDAELYGRADVVVHGLVVSSDVTVDDLGRPETLTIVEPISLLKGHLSGSLVLHQLGGVLPDGRFFQMWGRPEYVPGREVIVFAIARAKGEFETAEMLLGKFEVSTDEAGDRFAVPDLAAGHRPGVDVLGDPGAAGASMSPRRLDSFLSSLQRGVFTDVVTGEPAGVLTPVEHSGPRAPAPEWGQINNILYRWNNNATASWAFNGTANITGGGVAEATGALATWTSDPVSSINYVPGAGSNVIYLNATSSALGCGWSTCLTGAGVIGCGGPSGGANNAWRGDVYRTITGGTVELRAYCSTNGYDSVTTRAVITHELGHTLGLGHSDQNVSPHDVCRGDEGSAQMRSVVQHSIALGTDDQDAIRWVYGDGLNSCTPAGPPTVSGIAPPYGSSAGNGSVSISGSNFGGTTSVSIGGTAASVTSVTATAIGATTGPHAVGSADVVVTNPGSPPVTLPGAFFYDFLDVPASDPQHGFVVKLFKDSITAGCGTNVYCPSSSVTRGQMAVFLLRSKNGATYNPPACSTPVFSDVPCSNGFAAWIGQLSALGVTSGCGGGLFCPGDPVTRAQMAVLLLRTHDGSAYTPPACTTAPFTDVPCSSGFAAWIQELVARGITTGCGGGNYCPSNPATRGQMAVFLVTTFGLP